MDRLKFLINPTEQRAKKPSDTLTMCLVSVTLKCRTVNAIDASSSYRVVATELHGTADDHDSDELPAH